MDQGCSGRELMGNWSFPFPRTIGSLVPSSTSGSLSLYLLITLSPSAKRSNLADVIQAPECLGDGCGLCRLLIVFMKPQRGMPPREPAIEPDYQPSVGLLCVRHFAGSPHSRTWKCRREKMRCFQIWMDLRGLYPPMAISWYWSIRHVGPLQAIICRFSIPQKLSNRTLSFPCIHLTCITCPPSPALICILKPKTGCSSSSSSSLFAHVASSMMFFCFRLAARDHTLLLARPMPVDRVG